MGAVFVLLMACGCLDLLLLLGWLIWYVITLFLVRGAVAQHVRLAG